jgi:hypothetical protein
LGPGKTTRKTIATRLRGWFICFNPEFSLPEFSWFLDLWGQKKKRQNLTLQSLHPSQLLRISSKSPAFRKSVMVDEYFLTSQSQAPGRRNIPRFLILGKAPRSLVRLFHKINIRMAGKPQRSKMLSQYILLGF